MGARWILRLNMLEVTHRLPTLPIERFEVKIGYSVDAMAHRPSRIRMSYPGTDMPSLALGSAAGLLVKIGGVVSLPAVNSHV